MKKLLVLILACAPAFGALSTTTVWQVNASATAANVNGGGFNPANANFPTDLACTSATGNAPVCSSASYNFAAGDVNAYLFVKSGTNWNANGAGANLGGGCFYPISSVATNQATVDATIGHYFCISDGGVSNTAPNIPALWVAGTVAGIATVASPTAGTWGVDYSHGTAAGIAYTDLIIGGTTTQYTSSANPVGVNVIGNLISVNSGTNCTVQRVEVVSTATTTATVDKTLGTAASTCSANLGGAVSLGSSTASRTDDDFFETCTSAATSANMYWIKSGNYVLGNTVSIAATGNTKSPCAVAGYTTKPGDAVAWSALPRLSTGANTFTAATAWSWRNVFFIGSGGNVFIPNVGNSFINSKCVNISSTASQNCISQGSTNVLIRGSEIISYRGRGVNVSASTTFIDNYIHDSDVGVLVSAAPVNFINNVIAGNVTAGIKGLTSAQNTVHLAVGNTLVGYITPTGIGYDVLTGEVYGQFYNNIFYGFVTGLNFADAQQYMQPNFNDYFNNTNNTGNVYVGVNSLTLDPQFTSLSQVANLGTVSSSTNVLTDSGASFSVTDGSDYVYLVSGTGTGFAAGIYPISAHTATTLTFADPLGNALNVTTSGSGSSIVYRILSGRNFAIGTNLKAAGYPANWPNNSTLSYMDIGAAQRQEPTGTAGVTGAVQ